MKILYLCPDLGIPVLGRKGASVHVREMSRAFAKAGHDVVLAAQTLNKSPWETPAQFDVPIVQVRPAPGTAGTVMAFKEFNETLGAENSIPGELRRILYNKELAGELKRRFENDPPHFIYERASLYATAGVLLARELDIPLIVELNAPLADEQTAYRATGFAELAARAERWTLNNADAVVVVSDLLRQHVLSLGVKPRKIHVMPNGVNPDLFHPGTRQEDLRRRLQLNGGPVLGFVGGLRPWHGVEMLPPLLKRICSRRPDAQLIIAGDGPLRARLETGFANLGLKKNAVFTGLLSHEEVPEVIRQFDLALAPYPRADHAFYFSPLKLFEYMACGVPVVAAKLGQIAEIVQHGKTGLLYPPGNLAALAARCQQLLARSDLRARIGKAASNFVHKKFGWEKNAARVIALAESLTGSRR